MSYLWLPYMIIPIFAGLERIPNSLLEASGDLGARAGTTFRRVVLPMVFPAVVAGSIFTFSLTLGDYITPTLVSSTQFIGNVIYSNVGVAGNQPLAAAYAFVPGHRHDRSTCSSRAGSARSRRCDGPSRRRAGCCGSPPASPSPSSTSRSAIIVLYSFNASPLVQWPITQLTLDW